MGAKRAAKKLVGWVAGWWGFTNAQANFQSRNPGNSSRYDYHIDRGDNDFLSYLNSWSIDAGKEGWKGIVQLEIF